MSIKECKECEGRGYIPCHGCNGDGKVFWPGVSGKNYPCPDCNGTGKEECIYCQGRGWN